MKNQNNNIDYTVTFSFSENDLNKFASLSGDYNKIHNDINYCKSKGFNNLVVYGGLIISKISKYIGMNFIYSDVIWSSLEINFISPAFIEEKLIMHINQERYFDDINFYLMNFEINMNIDKIADGNFIIKKI